MFEIVVLLVAEGLDGGRIEDAIAVFEVIVNRKFAGLSFTRACGRTDEDVMALINGRECVFLPLVGGMREGKLVH